MNEKTDAITKQIACTGVMRLNIILCLLVTTCKKNYLCGAHCLPRSQLNMAPRLRFIQRIFIPMCSTARSCTDSEISTSSASRSAKKARTYAHMHVCLYSPNKIVRPHEKFIQMQHYEDGQTVKGRRQLTKQASD